MSLIHFIRLIRFSSLSSSRVAARDERGQAAAEYALVLLGAAAVALLLVSWATHTNLVGKLLDTVLGHLLGKVV
jgi:Flp pilus assembly pilin Flp